MDISLNEMCESLCTKSASNPSVLAFILDFGNEEQIAKALDSVTRDLTSQHTSASARAEMARVIAERNRFSDQGECQANDAEPISHGAQEFNKRKKPGRKPKVLR